jgi:hypothetical protein
MKIYRVMACMIFFVPGLIWGIPEGGIGDFANAMIEPVGLLAHMITAASIMIGVGCLFGGFLRYTQFRINPLAAPLSSVITLVVLGLVLLALPLLNYFFSDVFSFLR